MLIICALLVVLSLLHLGSALRLGDDEGYEVIKGLLCSKGYHLYTDIWNDQPPVSTFLLAGAFKLFGASILTARIVAASFGLILAICFYELIRQRSGARTALLGAFFVVAAPGSLVVMASMMLECPAFATALLSCWLAFRWAKRQSPMWLVLSGAMLAVALQIKLTAVLVVPALVIEMFLILHSRHKSIGQMLQPGLVWGAALVAVFFLIALTWGKGSLATSWKSHTKAEVVPGLDMPADHKFNFRLLRNNIECAGGAVMCILLATRRRRLRELAFPVALLCTVSLVHAFHRPWWNYYYLHFAIPLAWLTGWAVNALLEDLYRVQTKNRSIGFKFASGLALCALIAFALAKSERRFEGSIKYLREKPAASANAIVQKMRQSATGASCAYSEDGIYAFHAGVKVIPDLAIVMPKRFWSGQISTRGIIEICKRNAPQFVVVRSDSFNEEWRDYLRTDYGFGAADNTCQLYVRK
ncbi:MAG TPA: glycosyltransferase family 39 protein [Candidatus Acidoferrum sp.]|nr:glycosyltransferase family 39 protein [Candidatus Acidoferrum sp.]